MALDNQQWLMCHKAKPNSNLMSNPYAEKNSCNTIQLRAGKDKGVHAFLKGINQKVNIIVWLEFELTTMLQSSTMNL